MYLFIIIYFLNKSRNIKIYNYLYNILHLTIITIITFLFNSSKDEKNQKKPQKQRLSVYFPDTHSHLDFRYRHQTHLQQSPKQ